MLKQIRDILLRVAGDIDAGNSNITEEEGLELMKHLNVLTNWDTRISKYEAIKILGVSRATFDNYIRAGKLPEGQRQVGFKEKFWLKRDIEEFKKGI